MASCHQCGTGLAFKKKRRIDKKHFCADCAPLYVEQRRHRRITDVLAGRPTELLRLPGVAMCNPDRPAGAEKHYGTLILTDRGPVFVAIERYSTSSQTGWFLALGIIGAAIAQSEEANKRKQCAIRVWGDTRSCRTLDELLEDCDDVFFWPAEEILKIRLRRQAMTIKTAGAKRIMMWQIPAKIWKKLKPALTVYCEALRMHTDLASAYRQYEGPALQSAALSIPPR